MKTERVLFVENAELQWVGGGGPKYNKGEVHDLRPDQAQRWYSRGKAVPAPEAVAVEVPADPPHAGIPLVIEPGGLVSGLTVTPVVDSSEAETVTAEVVNVDDLSAIDANLGTVTPASVTSRHVSKPKGGKKS